MPHSGAGEWHECRVCCGYAEALMPTFSSLAPHAASIGHYLQILLLAAALGAALGLVRPVRREIIPRSAHVI